jgi:hypothetical protein
MVLATDDVGMSILLDPKLSKSLENVDFWGSADDAVGFNACFETLDKAVHSEINMADLMKSQGYQVDAMSAAFHEKEWDMKGYCEYNGNPSDSLSEGSYYGTNVHPYEMIFFKTNRFIAPKMIEEYTKWHIGQRSVSWENCRR